MTLYPIQYTTTPYICAEGYKLPVKMNDSMKKEGVTIAGSFYPTEEFCGAVSFDTEMPSIRVQKHNTFKPCTKEYMKFLMQQSQPHDELYSTHVSHISAIAIPDTVLNSADMSQAETCYLEYAADFVFGYML